MKLRRFTLTALAAIALPISGCDSVLDDVRPYQQVAPSQLLPSQAGFEGLLVSAYDRLQNFNYYGQYYMLYPDALADNIEPAPTTSGRYPNVVNNVQGAHLTLWDTHYSGINDANIILSQVENLELSNPSDDIEDVRNQIRGEALFLRAINYFDLVRTKAYEPGREVGGWDAGVIIRTEPTLEVAAADYRARSTNQQVYDLIISDLEEAASIIGAPTTLANTRTAPRFIGPAAVNALLARVQLYARNWAEAEAAAEQAIALTSASLVVDDGSGQLFTAWQAATHPESIFELEMTYGTNGDATWVNQSLQSVTYAPRGGFFDAVPTASLLGAYDEGDARLDLYGATSAGVPFIQKYPGTLGQDTDRIPIFRVSEMLLILAEARAEQNDLAGALDALNTLRSARTLDDLEGDDVDTDAEIVDAVYAERRRELAFEGHRFFDLKRRAMDIPKPQTAAGVIPYSDFRILAQLPTDEVQSNELLVQNPGY